MPDKILSTAIEHKAADSPDGNDIRLESLPKEFGILMIVAGIGGLILPGPVGTPLLIVGGVVLFPKVFQRVDRAFQRRFPKTHQEGMRQVKRFVVDLERRYPSK